MWYGIHGTAGYNLSFVEDVIIPRRGKGVMRTRLAISIPVGTYGRIASRLGLAIKQFSNVTAGIVDADYHRELGILLFDHATDDLCVRQGDRVAQLILEKINTPVGRHL